MMSEILRMKPFIDESLNNEPSSVEPPHEESISAPNHSISGKRRARKLALQALYQWQMAATPLREIELQFHHVNNMSKVDLSYFQRLLHGVPGHLSQIETQFTPFLDRSIEVLNPIELTALRLSTFELIYCLEIPYRVILDEAVALTKAFGSQDGYRYVNGVLNNLCKNLRALEISMESHNTIEPSP